MNLQTKNHKIKVTSLSDNDIITQETLTISEHAVSTQYLLLSDNTDFKYNQEVYSPGIFNKKTNFVIGEKESIIVLDQNGNSKVLDTSQIIDNDYYLIYPIPCYVLQSNEYLDVMYKGESYKLYLSGELGYDLGLYLSGELIKQQLQDKYGEFIKYFIDNEKGKSIQKSIIINSNIEFVINILNGYYEGNSLPFFKVNNNVNIYTFTTILNYLGASYSIRNSSSMKKIMFKLPAIFSNLSINQKFKNLNYYAFNSENNIELMSYNPKNGNDLYSKVNSGKILLIPVKDIDFISTKDNRMYDLTSERADATNYALVGTPIMKNSDGDILAASGIFTKEGLQDAAKFSPEQKEYYRDLNTGDITNWIADDAILGLYNSTTQLKK